MVTVVPVWPNSPEPHLDKFITSHESYKNGNISKAIERGFIEIDNKMREDNGLVEEMSGSTAVVVLIKDNMVYCGNAGDSRAIAYVKDKTVPLSVDHKPSVPEETRRINDAGGWVEANRVNGNLAVSRALGDYVFKMDVKKPPEEQSVTAFPEVKKGSLTKDWKFIVLACDGIWDVMSSDEVGDFVQQRLTNSVRPDTVCEELMMNCLASDVSGTQVGCDNMTVVIVQIVNLPETSTNAAINPSNIASDWSS
uniref:protein-serine/threonine phosphatase n=1 Tax=Lygus hesperus TaxID=30085 RepID=A0A0A9W275_LYGHE